MYTRSYSISVVGITGGTINGTTIGATTPAAGAFTTVTASGDIVSAATTKWRPDGNASGNTYAYEKSADLLVLTAGAVETVSVNATGVGIGAGVVPAYLLDINQGAEDGIIQAWRSSDVAHGMTDLAPTNVYGYVSKASSTSGGLLIRGLKSEAGSAGYAINFEGILGEEADTTKSASGVGVFVLNAMVKNGTTSKAVGTDGNLLTIVNYSTTQFIFDAEGSGHANVEWTVF